MMQSPQKMPAGHVVVYIIHTLPRGLPAGAVAHPQENASDELNHQGEGQRTSPNIAPPRTSWHIFEQCLANVIANTRAVIQPVVSFFEVFHASGRAGLERDLLLGVGLKTLKLNPNLAGLELILVHLQRIHRARADALDQFAI